MLTTILTELFERDLNKLKEELDLYENDADLWLKPGRVPNSAGNLALHLCGNLQHFFGAVLGNSGYVRDRDSEFTRTGVPRDEILAEIDTTLSIVKQTLADLSDEDLAALYPIEVFGKPMTTGWFATHLATHLTWHLGQITYHRRMV
ncbi:MAG TPA: DinB family protein [Pyrinomonadaceae bacterium]|nr:DinB family protein [Pyrinomonadaceae bacterium]